MINYIHGFYSSRTDVYNHKLLYIKFMGMNEIPTTTQMDTTTKNEAIDFD